MDLQLTDRALEECLPDWGVLLLESHHSPVFEMEWRTHSFLKIVYVLDGKGEFQFANRSVSFEAGNVIIVPPETKNRIEDAPASPSSLFICCLETSLFNFDSHFIEEFDIQRIDEGRHSSSQVAASMRRLAFAQNKINRLKSVAMVSEAMDLVQHVFSHRTPALATLPKRQSHHQQEEVAHYVQNLKNEFFEATSIDAAAEQLSMPRRTFTKLFLEQTGETWLQHVRRLAIEHSVVRLIESDSAVISIAFECRFNDLSTFYRQFKSQIGMSPAAFRAESRKNENDPAVSAAQKQI